MSGCISSGGSSIPSDLQPVHHQQMKRSASFGKLTTESLFKSASNPNLASLSRSKPYEREPGASASTMSVGSAEEVVSAKRLARKAELARQSRLRKKKYISELEQKADTLVLQVQEAEWQAQVKEQQSGVARSSSTDSKRSKGALLLDGDAIDVERCNESQLEEILKKFQDNMKSREENVLDMLQRIRSCLEPGPQVQFACWTLDRPEQFYSGDGMWARLCSQFGITEAQSNSLHKSRSSLSRDRKTLHSIMWQLDEMAQLVSRHFSNMMTLTQEFASVISRRELARFFVWVEKNDWMLHMLDEVFDDKKS